jgi:COMPASS component SWD3
LKCLKEDKNVFFSGGWDSMVQIFDVRVASSPVRKFFGPLISSDSIDYKDGILLAGNYRNKDILQLWDFKSGQLIETLDIK